LPVSPDTVFHLAAAGVPCLAAGMGAGPGQLASLSLVELAEEFGDSAGKRIHDRPNGQIRIHGVSAPRRAVNYLTSHRQKTTVVVT